MYVFLSRLSNINNLDLMGKYNVRVIQVNRDGTTECLMYVQFTSCVYWVRTFTIGFSSCEEKVENLEFCIDKNKSVQHQKI